MSFHDSGFRPWPKKEYELWKPKRRRRRSSESDPERRFGRRKRWGFCRRFRVAAALVLVVAAGTVILWYARPRDEAVVQPLVAVAPDFSAASLREQWTGPPPRRVAEAFLRASTNDERLQWVRNPEQTRLLLEQWFAGPTPYQPDLATLMALEVTNDDSRLNLDRDPEHARFVVEAAPDDWRFLAIVRTPDGGKVDFPSFIRHGSAPWPAILGGTVAEADVRVFVAVDNYHNFAYGDEAAWRNYTMSSPDCEEAVHLYLPVGSKLEREMPLHSVEPPRRMFLRIRHTSPDNLTRRQFELVAILAPGWTE